MENNPNKFKDVIDLAFYHLGSNSHNLHQWLYSDNKAFGKPPIEHMSTEKGVADVYNYLMDIGVFNG